MRHEKLYIRLLITVEIIWIMLLTCLLIAGIQVITARADEPKQIINGEYVITEIHTQDNAIDINEAPPIQHISNALNALDALDKNPYLGITISDEEANELRWVLALEAQGEGFEGEIAVCEVIFNRVLSGRWGEGIHGVLSKKGQFSTYKYIGSRKAWCTPGQVEDDAISECIRRGPEKLPDMTYVYFDTGAKNGKRNIRIGHHWFGAE